MAKKIPGPKKMKKGAEHFKPGDRVSLTEDNMGAVGSPDVFHAGTIGVIDKALPAEQYGDDWYMIKIGESLHPRLAVSFVPAHISMFKKWEG
jgi:hypothetical protein